MDTASNLEGATVRVIASSTTWIESDAVRQLRDTARLAGMKLAVGLPDLHPGKGNPIGAAFLTEEWIYPALVGSDIGCGMGVWQTELKTNKIKLDKWSKQLDGLDVPWEGDVLAWLAAHDVASSHCDATLGTIGGGNHFVELQRIESVYDEAAFAGLGLHPQSLYLLVHSGSRGLGESILRAYADQFHGRGLQATTAEAAAYLVQHDHAVRWAQSNRALIAHRFMTALRTEGSAILDICHNMVTRQNFNGCACWLHRKGATPTDKGLVVIPGSRGDFSYFVRPTGNQHDNAFSLAHGAGRKWQRGAARGRLERYRPSDFLKTSLGSMVICNDKDLIFEEAPQAYKSVESVVGDLEAAGLIERVAKLRPVLTYKTRRTR